LTHVGTEPLSNRKRAASTLPHPVIQARVSNSAHGDGGRGKPVGGSECLNAFNQVRIGHAPILDNCPLLSMDKGPLSARTSPDYCPCMHKSFRDALLAALEDARTPLRAVADGAGVSYDQLVKLKNGRSRSTNVDDAIKIASFFGKSLDEFMGDRTQAQRAEIVSLYNQLTPQERDLLLAAARGFHARPLEEANE
jgi:transcriptional regulator with XRE-family HTH domain